MDIIVEIRESLFELKKLDINFSIFGSASYRYELNQRTSVDQIKIREKEHSITLPSDYVNFITQIGDGGAGIDYGMMDFEYAFKLGKPDKPFLGTLNLLNETFHKCLDKRYS
jgi:hypothetical protein